MATIGFTTRKQEAEYGKQLLALCELLAYKVVETVRIADHAGLDMDESPASTSKHICWTAKFFETFKSLYKLEKGKYQNPKYVSVVKPLAAYLHERQKLRGLGQDVGSIEPKISQSYQNLKSSLHSGSVSKFGALDQGRSLDGISFKSSQMKSLDATRSIVFETIQENQASAENLENSARVVKPALVVKRDGKEKQKLPRGVYSPSKGSQSPSRLKSNQKKSESGTPVMKDKTSVTVTVTQQGTREQTKRDHHSDGNSTQRIDNQEAMSPSNAEREILANSREEIDWPTKDEKLEKFSKGKNQRSAFFGSIDDVKASEKTKEDKIWNLQYVYQNPRVDGSTPQTTNIRIAQQKNSSVLHLSQLRPMTQSSNGNQQPRCNSTLVQASTSRLDAQSKKSGNNMVVRDLMKQYMRRKTSGKDSQTLDATAFGSKRSKYEVRQNVNLAVPVLSQLKNQSKSFTTKGDIGDSSIVSGKEIQLTENSQSMTITHNTVSRQQQPFYDADFTVEQQSSRAKLGNGGSRASTSSPGFTCLPVQISSRQHKAKKATADQASRQQESALASSSMPRPPLHAANIRRPTTQQGMTKTMRGTGMLSQPLDAYSGFLNISKKPDQAWFDQACSLSGYQFTNPSGNINANQMKIGVNKSAGVSRHLSGTRSAYRSSVVAPFSEAVQSEAINGRTSKHRNILLAGRQEDKTASQLSTFAMPPTSTSDGTVLLIQNNTNYYIGGSGGDVRQSSHSLSQSSMANAFKTKNTKAREQLLKKEAIYATAPSQPSAQKKVRETVPLNQPLLAERSLLAKRKDSKSRTQQKNMTTASNEDLRMMMQPSVQDTILSSCLDHHETQEVIRPTKAGTREPYTNAEERNSTSAAEVSSIGHVTITDNKSGQTQTNQTKKFYTKKRNSSVQPGASTGGWPKSKNQNENRVRPVLEYQREQRSIEVQIQQSTKKCSERKSPDTLSVGTFSKFKSMERSISPLAEMSKSPTFSRQRHINDELNGMIASQNVMGNKRQSRIFGVSGQDSKIKQQRKSLNSDICHSFDVVPQTDEKRQEK